MTAAKGIKCTILVFSAKKKKKKKTNTVRNFSKLILVTLLPTESTTERRNEHKDSRSVQPGLKPERSR